MDTRMQKEGSQYGLAPGTASYPRTVSQVHAPDHLQQQLLQQNSEDAAAALAEAASPISSRPPAPGGATFVQLTPGAGGIPEDDVFAAEDSERGTTAGNRWPQQETLALLKIRSEMDATFKEANLKGPLWEDVSRKLAELGYSRSAKKCKEKFENVQKYYKRTKEGRAGRQDGKNYRFFSELEALHSGSGAPNASTTITATPAVPISVAIVGNIPMVGSSSGQFQPTPISIHVVSASQRPDSAPTTAPAGVSGSGAAGAAGVCSFASDTSFSSDSEDDELEEGLNTDAPKRQRTELVGKKMMAFFERLMKEVVEKQERMLESFLETIDKREQERMIREEAWRRQEMARLNREQEIMAQERAISAARDAALIAFLQKFTGQTIQIVTIPAAVPPPQQKPPPPQSYPPRPPQPRPHQQQHQQQQHQNQPPISTEIVQTQRQSSELVLVQQEQLEITGGSFDSTSSRWPKAEVLALIKLRSDLELKYQEAGPKGPLWEEISKQMQQLGHNRSAKRCKEKWENINKYFKKVKESKKKRPKDAKTCPYFHQLDALYHKKLLKSGADGAPNSQEPEMHLNSGDVLPIPPTSQSQTATDINTDKIGGTTNVGVHLQVQTSNGGLPPNIFGEGTLKKREDNVKELMAGTNHHLEQAVMDDYDKTENNDYLDEDDDDNEEDEDVESEEEKKMAYKNPHQRPDSGPSSGQEKSNSFMAMAR